MSKFAQVRTQLENKIFVPYGRVASHYRTPTIVYDNRGEIDDELTSFDSTEISIVDYDITTSRLSLQSFGKIREGDRTFITNYLTTLVVGEYLFVDGQLFKIINVETPRLPEVIVNIVDVVKSTDTVTIGVTYLIQEEGDLLLAENGDSILV